MKTNQGVLVGAAAVALVWGAVSAFQMEDEQPEMTPEQEAEWAAWEAAGTPGPQHAQLGGMIGEWDCHCEFWMAPDAPPTITEGTSVSEWVLGGRIIKSDFSTTIMGMPFQGLMYSGYDNIKGEYFSIWMDSSMTGYMADTGTANADGTEVVYTGGFTDPMGNPVKTKHIARTIDHDKTVFEMWESKNGEDMRLTGKITYTRK